MSINEKQLLEIRKEFNETQEKLTQFRVQSDNNSHLSIESLLELNSLEHNWIHSKLFTDSDGIQKTFIFPKNENKIWSNWDKANNICNKYNAPLGEINSQQK